MAGTAPATTAPTTARRKNGTVRRRRVEDEEGSGHEDDSMTEESGSEDEAEDVRSVRSEGTHRTESPVLRKVVSNGHAKRSDDSTAGSSTAHTNGTTHSSGIINGFENIKLDDTTGKSADGTSEAASQPAMIEARAAMDQMETPVERRRREHEDYKKQRDENPAFVPNRGAFFMHDHRHAGPAANGFRPFGRPGRGRGGRGGIGGAFAPGNFMPSVNEPTDSPWTHDMHEAVLEDNRSQRSQSRQSNVRHTYQNIQTVRVPLAPRGPAPNRALSSTKLLGNVQIRVFLPHMEKSLSMPSIAIHQYTRLPDHRPPLRRDKPVRISMPDIGQPRYIFPALERSFIFIPRAQRPNQQGFGSRSNRGRQGLGSVGGFSRRTSVYGGGGGGSIYGGSVYSPSVSVAMSRRGSLIDNMIPHDSIMTPMGSTMSRPQMQTDSGKPVVRFPPTMQQPYSMDPQQLAEAGGQFSNMPQTYPIPHKPATPQFRENRQNSTPMQHPRPQKAVSVDNIESPAALQYTAQAPQQFQQPFSQQLPPMANGGGYGGHPMMPHSRNTSYQGSTGTPLSQIPERAIYAQPFHPHAYQQQQEYYPQQYPMMATPQQGFYYPQQPYAGSMASMTSPAPTFSQQIPQQMSQMAQPMQQQVSQQSYMSPQPVPIAAPAQVMSPEQQPGVVTQEVNGMFYYYDASQIPAVAAFPAFAPGAQQGGQMMGQGLQGQMVYPVQQLQQQQMMNASPAPDMMGGVYYAGRQGMQGQMVGGVYYQQ